MRQILVAIVLFFFITNTIYFWETYVGIWLIPILFILLIVFIILLVILAFQIFIAVQENFTNKNRIRLIPLMFIILLATFTKPTGIIDFEHFEQKNILIAKREGGGNCQTELKLKVNNTFYEKSYCFAVNRVRGKYSIQGDTIFFYDMKFQKMDDYYEYGVIQKYLKNDYNYLGQISLFKSGDSSWNNFLYLEKIENIK